MLQSLAMAGVFVDESSENDLTNTFGLRMKIKDLQALLAQAQNKKANDSGDDK